MRHSLKLTSLLVFTLVVISFLSRAVNAQEGSVTVSPAIITTSVSSLEPEKIESVLVKNNFSKQLRLAAVPYGVDSQNGHLSASEEPDSNLSKVVSISNTEFTLDPGQSIDLKILIRDSSKLSPGGHYAAIVIKQIDDGGGNIGIQQAVGISLYIIKEDGAIRSLVLNDSSISKFSLFTPSSANLAFQNTGNVVVVPRAAVTISSGSDIFAKGAANVDSVPVAPGDEIVINTELIKLKTNWWPSKQTLSIQYRYDGQNDDDIHTAAYEFWHVPWQSVAGLFVVVGLIFLARKKLLVFAERIRKKQKLKKVKSVSTPKPLDKSKKPKTKKTILVTDAKPAKKIEIK